MIYDRIVGKIRSLTVSVFRRISPYTVTDIYDRNTITCFMAKYGRIRSVYGMYTVVCDTVYDCLRPYTESVTVDLGTRYVGSVNSFKIERTVDQRTFLLPNIPAELELDLTASTNLSYNFRQHPTPVSIFVS